MLQQDIQTPVLLHSEQQLNDATRRGRLDFTRHVTRGLWFMTGVLLIGSVIDLGVLWVLQRQNQPQWEFVAIANTLDAFPRFALALAGAYLALFVGRSTSLISFRVLATAAILLGVVSAALGALMVTDYLALAKLASTQQQVVAALKSAMVKAGALSVFFCMASLLVGILGWRRPSS